MGRAGRLKPQVEELHTPALLGTHREQVTPSCLCSLTLSFVLLSSQLPFLDFSFPHLGIEATASAVLTRVGSAPPEHPRQEVAEPDQTKTEISLQTSTHPGRP